MTIGSADNEGNNNYEWYKLQPMSELDGTNKLVSYYREYIGDPDSTTDIYAGFGTFFLGLSLCLAGLFIFLYSASLAAPSYALREVAIISGAIGAPGILIGTVILLPVDRRMLLVAGGGSVICAVGVLRFATVYPNNFNVTANTDYAAQVVGIYSVGLGFVVASTAAALIAHRVEQASETAATTTVDEDDDEPTVTDEQVEADIQAALADTEITWGGVEKRETKRLSIDTTDFDDIDRESLSNASVETRTTSSNVDDAVSELKGLQGGNVKTATGDSTDDQVAALRKLQNEQNAATTEQEPSVSDRLRNFLFK